MMKPLSSAAPLVLSTSTPAAPLPEKPAPGRTTAEDSAQAKRDREAAASARPNAFGRSHPQLMRMAQAPNVSDHFMHQYVRVASGKDVLPNDAKSYHYLWVAGFIDSEAIDLGESPKALRAQGLAVTDVQVSANKPLADNVAIVIDAIEKAAKGGKPLVLLGYSWGGVAIADAIAQRPDLRPFVRGVGTMNAPHGGNDLVTEVMSTPAKGLVSLAFRKLAGADPRALTDQMIENRAKRRDETPYPKNMPTVTLSSQSLGWTSGMKLNELFLKARGRGESDGFVTVEKAMLPGAARVVVRGVDHLGAAIKPGLGTQAQLDAGKMTVALTSLVLERAAVSSLNNEPYYEARNLKLVAELPQFAAIYKDPDAFVASMKERFAAQKAKAPHNPYGFDFSELGMPLLLDMKKALEEELAKLEQPSEHKPTDLATGKRYMRALKEEVESHLEDGEIDYRRTIELSRFVSRAMGHFEIKELTGKERLMLNLDRLQLGFRNTYIAEEEKEYDDNRFRMFDYHSSVPLVRGIEKEFVDAVFDPNELKMILVPTNKDLSQEALMRLSMHPIRFVGVTRSPIPADGFMRAGGDFYNHDTRHYNSIYVRLEEYKRKFGMSEAGMKQVQRSADRWDAELKAALEKVSDPEARAALDLVIFNLHHDQGFPTVPSTYQDPNATSWLRAETGPFVTTLLYGLLKTSGQPLHFDHGIRRINEAYQWLENFWLARLGEEEALHGQ